MNNATIWILGAGKFGRLAVNTILASGSDATITLVDHDPKKLDFRGIQTICKNGIEWLGENLKFHHGDADIIIPTIPLHVAAEWLTYKLNEKKTSCHPTNLPDFFFRSLPNPIRTTPDQIITSFAKEICPLSCSEPDGYCSYTGEKRSVPLFELLKTAAPPGFTSVILQSHQLFPGIGGLYPIDFQNLIKHASQPGVKKMMIGTACRCHGIVNAIQFAA